MAFGFLISTHAFAEDAAAQPSLIESLVPFLLIFVMMYFLLIRPQMKKAKGQASLISSLKAGDEIVTSGGLIGRIKTVAETFVVVDMGTTNLKVLKDNISRLTNPTKEATVVAKKRQIEICTASGNPEGRSPKDLFQEQKQARRSPSKSVLIPVKIWNGDVFFCELRDIVMRLFYVKPFLCILVSFVVGSPILTKESKR